MNCSLPFFRSHIRASVSFRFISCHVTSSSHVNDSTCTVQHSTTCSPSPEDTITPSSHMLLSLYLLPTFTQSAPPIAKQVLVHDKARRFVPAGSKSHSDISTEPVSCPLRFRPRLRTYCYCTEPQVSPVFSRRKPLKLGIGNSKLHFRESIVGKSNKGGRASVLRGRETY